jgi:hypothetical protein
MFNFQLLRNVRLNFRATNFVVGFEMSVHVEKSVLCTYVCSESQSIKGNLHVRWVAYEEKKVGGCDTVFSSSRPEPG